MVHMGKILNNLKLSYTTVVHNGIMTHRKQQKIKKMVIKLLQQSTFRRYAAIVVISTTVGDTDLVPMEYL